MTCRSWKIAREAHAPLHRPGECELCWEPCHNKVPHESQYGKRCRDCWNAIARAGMIDTTVALSLLNERSIPPDIIEQLSMSDIFVVAQSAQRKLASVGA
jgi:hypothetical protein